MRYLSLAVLVLLLASPASAKSKPTIKTYLDNFQLLTYCNPVHLDVSGDVYNTPKAKTVKEDLIQAITNSGESKLRAAHIYATKFVAASTPVLMIQFTTTKYSIYSYQIEMLKLVSDTYTGNKDIAATWGFKELGKHGQNTNYIVASVSQKIDNFIAEYLRVNATACRAKFLREAAKMGLLRK